MPMTRPARPAARSGAASASTRVLPGPGRRVDHRDAAAVGQRGERGGGLVLAQPAVRACVCAARASCACPVSASSAASGSAPSACAACARVRSARRRRAPARRCVLRSPAARAWRSGCRRAAGRRCARPRAASCAAPRPARVPPGRRPARTPSASARSARSSSSAAAAAGSRPVRGRTRPRCLIRSARVNVLLSCCASASAFCAARASSSSGGPAIAAPRGCAAARLAAACQTDGATEARLTPRVRASLSAHPACSCAKSSAPSLACAGGEVRRLRELRELALGGLAVVPLREPRGALAQVRGDGLAAGGEHAHHLRR